MCLIRIRPASPPPSPTIPARFVPAPRLSIQAPTPRLSNHDQKQGDQQRRSANSLPRKSSLKNPNRNSSFSSSSPLPSANNVTTSRAEENRHIRPQGSFVRERPKGEVRESAAVKAVNFASPPPSSSAASNSTAMDPIITTISPRSPPLAAQSPRSSRNSITNPAAAAPPSYTRPPPHAPQPPLISTSSSSATTRIPIVRQGSSYSYGVGPVRSSASSVDQIQASQLQRRLSSSTNIKVLGPTTSVEVVVAQRDEENRGYKIVRRVSQSTGGDAGKHERRHSRTLSSSNNINSSHWGDPRSSANSIRWADPRRVSGNSVSNGGQEWRKKKKDSSNPMTTTGTTAKTEPFGEEVPMRRLSSNPLPLGSPSSSTSTSSPQNVTRTIPLRTGALNFNPPPPPSFVTEESSASTAPLLQHHQSHQQNQQPPIVTTIMPPPPPPSQHKRTYSRSSIHKSNSTASKHRPHAQSLSTGAGGGTGPRNSQNSINNVSPWGDNPRASRASGRSTTTTRERIVVVEEGGGRREYWQREEG